MAAGGGEREKEMPFFRLGMRHQYLDAACLSPSMVE